jgi:SAM-dependent MidA family methyltransferase
VIEVADDGSLREHLGEPPKEWTWLPSSAPHGARVPIQERAGEWVTAMQASLSAGTVLAFDYCTAHTAELATVPWRQWLRTYCDHERGEHYLRNTGLQDVTAQVCLDQLPAPTAVCSQAQFLARWGIDELVEEGRAQWVVEAAAPSLVSLHMRSRVSEAGSLLDPVGLGAFKALEWACTTTS